MEFEDGRTTDWVALGICDGSSGDVCADCIGDPALGEFISKNATKTSCSYCGKQRDHPFASPLSAVVERMATIINEEFEHGDYNPGLDAFDLLDLPEIGFKPKNHRVISDVASFFNKRKWRWKHHTTSAVRRECGWNRFCERVMHSRRYTFWSAIQDVVPECHQDYKPPSKMLEEIKSVITELGLIHELPTGSGFWRARDHEQGKLLELPNEFTSPPLEKATKPNRMSPAGISMFYGADDFDMAVLEITPVGPSEMSPGQQASGVLFKSLCPLQILDLVKIPQGSYFVAPDAPGGRHGVEFLRRFSRSVSAPIAVAPGASELVRRLSENPQPHIDYVPTQVFTEYVRYHMITYDGKPIDGIRYRSSFDYHDSHGDRGCYVLFFEQDECMPAKGRKQSLECDKNSKRTVPLPFKAG